MESIICGRILGPSTAQTGLVVGWVAGSEVTGVRPNCGLGPDAEETKSVPPSPWVLGVTIIATPSLFMNSISRRWKAMARGELGGACAAGAVDGRVVGAD